MKPNKNFIIQETVKCRQEPNYTLTTYAKIKHPTKGVIPFDLYDFQEKVFHPFSESVCRTSQISEKGKIKSCSRILSANKNLPI